MQKLGYSCPLLISVAVILLLGVAVSSEEPAASRTSFSSAADPPTYAHFTGNFTDSAFDDDGDGWYDRLRPTAEVQVSEEGRFLITAHVNKGDDEWITSRRDWNSASLLSPLDTFLSVGTHYLPLSFSGEDIYRSGSDGPYNVRWLLRCEGGPDTITQVTSAYDHTAFGELPARAPHSLTDTGIDTDGDGLYDALRCTVSVLLSRTDRYSLHGWLTLGDTQMVAIASSVMDSIGPGVVTFTLDFPGPAIWEHRLDGPYDVRVWVEHLDEGQCEEEHFVTGPYSYTDFDPPAVRLNGLPTVTPLDLGWNPTTGGRVQPMPKTGDTIDETWPECTYTNPALFLAGGAPSYSTGSPAYGSAQFTGNFTDSVADDDGDGWYNHLLPAAEVHVTEEGSLQFRGWVFGGSHPRITSRPGWNDTRLFYLMDTVLAVGTHYVPLPFSGEDIFRSGEDGPYSVRWSLWSLPNDSAVLLDTITQVTAAYDHTIFGELPARAPHSLTDAGIDMDGDGLYDALRCSVSVLLSRAARYSMRGSLSVGDSETVASAWSTMDSVGPGVVTFALDFPGPDIWEHGLDGPYNVRVWIEHWDEGKCEEGRFVTGPYSYTDFDPPAVRLNGLPTITPLDLGWNPTTGGRVQPMPKTGDTIDETWPEFTYPSASRSLLAGGTPTDARGFSLYGYAHFTGNFTDSAFDDDDDGWYDRFRPTAELQVLQEGTFQFLGAVLTGTNEPIALRSGWNRVNFASFDTVLAVGVHHVPLTFSGEEIYRSGQDGPYNVDWAMRSGGAGEDAVQVTSALNHAAFGELPARAPHSLTDAGLDTDGDGLYDALRCTVSVLLSRTDRYSLHGWLTLGDTQMVAIASSVMDSVGPGVVTFTLDFPGPAIWDHRLDGPYDVRVWVEHLDEGQCEEGHFVTGPYSYTDFDPPAVRLNGLPTITPLDLGWNPTTGGRVQPMPKTGDTIDET